MKAIYEVLLAHRGINAGMRGAIPGLRAVGTTHRFEIEFDGAMTDAELQALCPQLNEVLSTATVEALNARLVEVQS